MPEKKKVEVKTSLEVKKNKQFLVSMTAYSTNGDIQKMNVKTFAGSMKEAVSHVAFHLSDATHYEITIDIL